MTSRLPSLLFLLLALGLGCTGERQTGQVAGTVTWQGKPIGMALVEAYPRPERDPSTPPVAEMPSSEDGSFALELPPGRYWLWARATVNAQDSAREQRLVGRFPRNPLEVEEGSRLQAGIALEDATGFASATGPAGAGARGKVSGAPLQATTVYAYRGHHQRPVGPGFAAAVVPDDAGAFRIDLAPGEYTLAARWRATGADYGTLQPGDRVAVAPLRVPEETYAEVGTMELHPLDEALWTRVAGTHPATATRIAGRVVDREGNPKAGIRVLAFDDPRMAGKPQALSTATGADGTFTVPLPRAGRYYLGARSRIGGPAEPGEWSGAHRGEDGNGMTIDEDQEVTGVEILVEEVW